MLTPIELWSNEQFSIKLLNDLIDDIAIPFFLKLQLLMIL